MEKGYFQLINSSNSLLAPKTKLVTGLLAYIWKGCNQPADLDMGIRGQSGVQGSFSDSTQFLIWRRCKLGLAMPNLSFTSILLRTTLLHHQFQISQRGREGQRWPNYEKKIKHFSYDNDDDDKDIDEVDGERQPQFSGEQHQQQGAQQLQQGHQDQLQQAGPVFPPWFMIRLMMRKRGGCEI